MVTYERLMELAGLSLLQEMSVEKARNIFSYYGETPSTDLGILKGQFHTLVKKYHPDQGGDADAMKEINSAYDILKVTDSPKKGEDEEIRRQDGYAFEDFSDVEYWKRRVKQCSGDAARPCTVYAFDGNGFTDKFDMEAAKIQRAREMMIEGVFTQTSRNTKVIGVVWHDSPKQFVAIYGDNKPQFSGFNITGWLNDPTKDQKLQTQIKAVYKK